jgi:hypothetical protein
MEIRRHGFHPVVSMASRKVRIGTISGNANMNVMIIVTMQIIRESAFSIYPHPPDGPPT